MPPGPSIRSPVAWYEALPPAAATGQVAGHAQALVKPFVALPSVIEQPPLNEHIVALHLGGPKRVQRWQGKRSWVQDVMLGSMTFMPAYQANRWKSEGPIEFAHLTLMLAGRDSPPLDASMLVMSFRLAKPAS